MAKKLFWDGKPVVVDYALKDDQGRQFSTTYALKTELPAPFVLSKATVEALGGIKIGYGENAKNYAVQLDADGKAFVTVPWTDTTYTLPTAADATLGGIKTGFTTAGKDYAVKVDASGNAHVEVPWTDTTYSEATTTQAGLMSAADKEKLDAVEDYVLPAATASSLGGVKIGAGLDVTADGTISVRAGGTADAVNWSGVIGRPFNSASTDDFVIEGSSDAEKVLKIKDTKWATQTFVTSQGFLKAADITTKLDKSEFNTFIGTTAPATYVAIEEFKANYLDANNVAYKNELPSVPTKVSELQNDAGYIKADVATLNNFYNKGELYTKGEVDSKIAAVKTGIVVVTEEKPEKGDDGTTYYVGAAAPYHVWVWEGDQDTGKWIDGGTTSVDLTGYVKGTDLTSEQIVLGNNGSSVKASGKTIAATLGSDDNTVPTSKAVRDVLATYATTESVSGTYATQATLTSELAKKQNTISVDTATGLKLTGAQLSTLFSVEDVEIPGESE